MVTVGLDLHKRYITAAAVDDAGTVLAEHRRLEPSLDALGRWLGAFPPPLTVALEATLYWHWLERRLTALGVTVIVAHPYQVKLIWQARTKIDPIDARKLAELARVHLLPAIWMPDPATRALRQLLRGRVFLVRQRTVRRNRIHAYLTAENLRVPRSISTRKQAKPGSRPWSSPPSCAVRSTWCSRITRSSPHQSKRSIAASRPM